MEPEGELRRQVWGSVRRFFVAAVVCALIVFVAVWVSYYLLISEGVGPA